MTLEIPIHDADQTKNLVYTLDKMQFEYKMVEKRKKVVAIVVTYEEPIELFYLGMTAAADIYGVFKTSLTR
jgi:DNA-binding transcriptional regulator WhiA